MEETGKDVGCPESFERTFDDDPRRCSSEACSGRSLFGVHRDRVSFNTREEESNHRRKDDVMGLLSVEEMISAVVVGAVVGIMIASKNKWISVGGLMLWFALLVGISYFIGYQMGHIDHICMPDSPKTFL